MPIANYKPDVTPVVTPEQPKVQPNDYKSIIYDDNNVPLHSLIAYIEGSPWTVTYYSQVVSKHNDLREIDPGQSNIYQQYNKINKLELRVSSPLTTSYDTESAITSANGNGIMYPFVIPNIADYFTADAGDNRTGLFRITNVERKTFNRDSAFYVDYEMVGYIEVLQTIYSDLTSKVIHEYYFSKARLVEGLQPLLKTSDYESITSLSNSYDELVDFYFSSFFNKRFMTLVIPGQDYGIYDSFLVDYLFKIVDSFDSLEMRLIKQISVDNDPYISQPQFWSILLNKDYRALSYCNRKMSLVPKSAFNSNAFMHGIAFSNLDYIVYPANPNLTAVVSDNPQPKSVSSIELQEVNNIYGGIADVLINQYTANTRTYDVIKILTYDDNYVLSNDFYQNTDQQSVLEILTKDYLRQNTIDMNMLLELVSRYRDWGRLEQYYYIPILMTLIKEANRSTYT